MILDPVLFHYDFIPEGIILERVLLDCRTGLIGTKSGRTLHKYLKDVRSHSGTESLD